MPFKIRDLMITVLPSDLDLDVFGSSPCDAGSSAPPGVPDPPPPPPPPGPDQVTLGSRADILELRLILQLALAELGGPLSPDQMRPRSLADIDELENKLSGALEEVRALRAQYGGGPVGH